jgi:hypothetical protein
MRIMTLALFPVRPYAKITLSHLQRNRMTAKDISLIFNSDGNMGFKPFIIADFMWPSPISQIGNIFITGPLAAFCKQQFSTQKLLFTSLEEAFLSLGLLRSDAKVYQRGIQFGALFLAVVFIPSQENYGRFHSHEK